jgi:hypothetical protein
MTQTIRTSGKKFENLQKKLKARNAAFRKLPRAMQRVAIAEDVIAQLRAKKFVAYSTYFGWGNIARNGHDGDDNISGIADANEAGVDLSACISQVTCSVCGIGSLFASAVLNANKLKLNLNTLGERAAEVEYLKRWFSEKQLDLVEAFFERWDEYDRVYKGIHIGSYVIRNSPIYREQDDTKRLKKIMENIISNNGKFDPFKGDHRIPS